MNKRYLHHLLVRLREVRYAYLLVALFVSLTVFVFAYRHNNVTALKLRDQLLAADKQNGDVEGALRKLRTYTYSHMNANLSTGTGIYPPIQLKYRYDRLVAAEQAKAANANQQLYTNAQSYCEQQITSRRTTQRVPCIQEYLDSHGSVAGQVSIPDALYKFDFVSPAWSPDLAGWSLVVSILLALMLAARWLAMSWLRRSLQ